MDFIEEHGLETILMKIYTTSIQNKASLLRLYFDGNYHKYRYRNDDLAK